MRFNERRELTIRIGHIPARYSTSFSGSYEEKRLDRGGGRGLSLDVTRLGVRGKTASVAVKIFVPLPSPGRAKPRQKDHC